MVRMTSKSLLAIASIIGLAASYPVRREVPQEHAHEDILRLTNTLLKQNNPNGIVDAVFGLLGNAAASTGQGKITNTDCLQAATADQAFTNAKAAGDVAGMTAALQFRAIERNTGAVGLASVACTGFNFQNPEIAALSQHQDPASPDAAAINKKITLELARQIAAIGGDPLDAIKTGTFAPGQIGDPTARGNTCDDPNDAAGCINTLNLLVPDATPEEIAAAVAGVDAPADNGAGAGNGAGNGANNGNGNNNNGNGNGNAATPPAGGLAGKNQNVGQCQVAGGGGGAVTPPAEDDGEDVDEDTGDDVDDGADDNVDDPAETCPPAVTVTVTAGAGPTEAPSTTAPAATEAPATTPPPASTTAPAPATGTGDALAPVNTGNIDFRKCTNPSIIFGAGLDNRKATEFSFLPADLTEFPHGSALNGQIIMQFTCDNLVNRCGFTNQDQTVIDCRAAQASVADRQKDPASADIFNAALGFKSNFASIDVNAPAQSQLTADVDAAGKPTFRNCKNPSVLFAGGLEGRAATELTFKPADDADFNHGTAKNAQIIYQFICDTLVNKCGFTNQDATVIKCRDTQQKLASLGNVGRSADEWNKALGFTTNFAKVDSS